jgi:FkbM family methyltransferase
VWQHPANAGHRYRSVLRATAFQVRGRLGSPTMATVGRRGRMWARPHSPAASKVVYANPPDWNEMLAWRRILRSGDLFIDVGSNVGSYALWAADLGVRVVAVEPSPEAVALLRANLALNDFPVTVLACALADRPGRLRLSRSKGPMNHLLMDDASGDKVAASGDEVAVDTLDCVLGDGFAAGVKIDVEGAERMVLEGARRALAERRIGVLQIEWNTASRQLLGETRLPVAELLGAYGYRLMSPDAHGVLHDIAAPSASVTDLFAVAPGFSPS